MEVSSKSLLTFLGLGRHWDGHLQEQAPPNIRDLLLQTGMGHLTMLPFPYSANETEQVRGQAVQAEDLSRKPSSAFTDPCPLRASDER
jgi:hypothetical protein